MMHSILSYRLILPNPRFRSRAFDSSFLRFSAAVDRPTNGFAETHGVPRACVPERWRMYLDATNISAVEGHIRRCLFRFRPQLNQHEHQISQ